MALLVLGIAVNLVAGQEPSVIGDAQELLDLAWSKEDSSSAARVLGEYYEQGGNVASLAGVFNSEESASPEARDFVITASIFEAVEANPEIVQFFADLFLAMIADDASSAVADITVAAIRSSQGQPAIFGQIFDLISDSEGCTAIQDTINSVQETTRSIGNIRGFLDEFIDGYKNLGACVDCFDETPDDAQTCAERKLFGQCTSDWLIDGYFCAKTCDLCTAVAAAPPPFYLVKKVNIYQFINNFNQSDQLDTCRTVLPLVHFVKFIVTNANNCNVPKYFFYYVRDKIQNFYFSGLLLALLSLFVLKTVQNLLDVHSIFLDLLIRVHYLYTFINILYLQTCKKVVGSKRVTKKIFQNKVQVLPFCYWGIQEWFCVSQQGGFGKQYQKVSIVWMVQQGVRDSYFIDVFW
eukprot:TRINITY_DN8703_c0_g1_i6.p1 TRINITY_DN8703_c0_g1~~TRINITY_DN8703_c0_g1_i6.p1  ORF type:complete len:451 (+),score=43.26 TRINITY_DN8703_c0_g1_i6:132-1355(+)